MTLNLNRDAASDVQYARIASRVFPALNNFEVAWVCLEYHGRVSHALMSDLNHSGDSEWINYTAPPSAEGEPSLTPEAAIKQATDEWMAASRDRNPQWAQMSPEEAVYDIVTRIWADEWLGQRNEGMIYAQEVAHLLEMPNPDTFSSENPIWAILDTLVTQEKVDMSGATIHPYTPRFRFPEEIHHLFAYMIEEPLGWPNGNAGDGTVYVVEDAIGTHTHFKHGKDFLGPDNFPHLHPRYLLMFGQAWCSKAADAIEQKGVEHLDLDPERVADKLESLAARFRAMASLNDKRPD